MVIVSAIERGAGYVRGTSPRCPVPPQPMLALNRRRFVQAIRRKDVNKMVSTRTEKVRICPHCGAYNGKVVKAGPLKLYHVKYLKLVPGSDADLEFVTARKAVRELTGLLDASPPKVQEDMTPLVVRDLFMRRVPLAVCLLAGVDKGVACLVRCILAGSH